MTTIFADDNSASRLMMKKLLERIDPDGVHYTVETAAEALMLLKSVKPDILFLDIEMPGINGIEAAYALEGCEPAVNVIFVTGHPEYARDALRVYCSGFIEKPFDEDDIRDAIEHLRYPVRQKSEPALLVRCTGHFAIFFNGEPFTFKRKLTSELFAYLVYKNGAMSTNGELLGILWEGAPEKADFLRQLVKDMRDSFESAGISSIVIKRHGSIGLNTEQYRIEGNTEQLNNEFQWL